MPASTENENARLLEWINANNHQLPQDATFYESLGRALGAWARVEGALYGMFLAVLKLPHRDASAAAFHAVVAFQGRLGMVASAAQFALQEPENVARWNELQKDLKELGNLRNKVAHYSPRREIGASSAQRQYLGPHPYDSSRAQKTPKPIYEADLLVMAKKFDGLASNLTGLHMKIMRPDIFVAKQAT